MIDSSAVEPEHPKRGGVTVFAYKTVADLFWWLRTNDFQTNALWLLAVSYLVIAVEIVKFAFLNVETAQAMISTLDLSDLVLVVPALTLGRWATTAATVLTAVAFSQFFANGLDKWDELSTSRKWSLSFWTLVVGSAVLTALLFLPIFVAVVFVAAFVVVSLAPRPPEPVRLGPRDHQTSMRLSLRAVVYASIYGARLGIESGAPQLTDRVPAPATSPNPRLSPEHPHRIIERYFDRGDDTYKIRQSLGLTVAVMLAFTLFWNLWIARPWIPAEVITVVPTETVGPAFDGLRAWLAPSDQSMPGAKTPTFTLVGRPLDDQESSLLVLTHGRRPKVLRIPTAWVRARRLCQEPLKWYERPMWQFDRYERCPD